MKKKAKILTTFEREIQDPDFKKAYDEEFREFALSELMLALMEDDKKVFASLPKWRGCHPPPYKTFGQVKQRMSD